ncbi:MAG TPA: DNA-processing protein DprA [Acidiferrobacterales bacterium]
MDQHDLVCWLLLHRITAGGAGLRALLERFGTPRAVFAADRAELLQVLAAQPRWIDAIREGAAAERVTAEFDWLKDPANRIVSFDDPHYPPLLREIPDPPPLLFVRGDARLLAQPQLAVVGSRNPTADGADNARAFGQALAGHGLVIVSGMALGIDAHAHRGALDAGGATVAVAGTGIDRVYPPQHHALAHEIAARGALVSEFPLGAAPRRDHFPRRNRIISGLSLGVLVVEAALKSGSLITARLAAEQGREVFAIPGSIHSPLSRGCHALIRQGAKLVESAADILEELGPLAGAARSLAGRQPPDHAPPAPANQAAGVRSYPDAVFTQLDDCLGYDPVDIDTLVARSGLTAEAVSSMLLQMELRGVVAARPGGKYQRVVPPVS